MSIYEFIQYKYLNKKLRINITKLYNFAKSNVFNTITEIIVTLIFLCVSVKRNHKRYE